MARSDQSVSGDAPAKGSSARDDTDSSSSDDAEQVVDEVGDLDRTADAPNRAPRVVQSPRPGQVEEYLDTILGGPRIYTSIQVAELAGADLALTGKLWRAMGFADTGDEVALSQRDVDALSLVVGLIDQGLINEEHAVEIVRGIGQSTSRLAEWQAHTMGRIYREKMVIQGASLADAEDLVRMQQATQVYAPVLESLIVYAWRRQLHARADRAANQVVDSDDPGLDTSTVGFADLVGFTRLSRQIAEGDLGELVEDFEGLAADVIAAAGGRVVKTLGDEVLFSHAEPVGAADIAVTLHDELAADPEMPQVRMGLATGPVISRMGDLYGTTVNRASRLTAMARPGATYVDADTAAGLEEQAHLKVKSMRPRAVRGFGLLRAWTVSKQTT